MCINYKDRHNCRYPIFYENNDSKDFRFQKINLRTIKLLNRVVSKRKVSLLSANANCLDFDFRVEYKHSSSSNKHTSRKDGTKYVINPSRRSSYCFISVPVL